MAIWSRNALPVVVDSMNLEVTSSAWRQPGDAALADLHRRQAPRFDATRCLHGAFNPLLLP